MHTCVQTLIVSIMIIVRWIPAASKLLHPFPWKHINSPLLFNVVRLQLLIGCVYRGNAFLHFAPFRIKPSSGIIVPMMELWRPDWTVCVKQCMGEKWDEWAVGGWCWAYEGGRYLACCWNLGPPTGNYRAVSLPVTTAGPGLPDSTHKSPPHPCQYTGWGAIFALFWETETFPTEYWVETSFVSVALRFAFPETSCSLKRRNEELASLWLWS